MANKNPGQYSVMNWDLPNFVLAAAWDVKWKTVVSLRAKAGGARMCPPRPEWDRGSEVVGANAWPRDPAFLAALEEEKKRAVAYRQRLAARRSGGRGVGLLPEPSP